MARTKAHGGSYVTKKGKKCRSVTTILGNNLGWNKQVLIGWARRQALAGHDPELVLKEAANIGTLAHYLVECDIKDEVPETSTYSAEQIEKANNALEGFKQWKRAYKPKFLGIELVLVDDELEVGGTADQIAKIGGQVVVGDIKSSKFLYDEHIIQLGAYCHMYERMQPKAKIEYGYVLRLDKETGAFTHHNISRKQLDWGWKVFLCCLELDKLKP
jgi:hypothetical protein